MENGQQITAKQRVALVIQYLGTHFHGWQRQKSDRTVQEEIENVLSGILNHPVTLHGAGRTDAGVHAAAHRGHDRGRGVPGAARATLRGSGLTSVKKRADGTTFAGPPAGPRAEVDPAPCKNVSSS